MTTINLLPDEHRKDPTSPYELFPGLKVDFARQLRISFGDYAECRNPNRKLVNGPKPRSDPCITLLPMPNQQGSYLFFDLGSRRTVIRTKWVELPFPDDIIARCNHLLASKQGKKLRVLPRDEDDNSIAEMSDHELFGHDDAPSSSDSDEDASVSSDETNTDDPNGDHINLSDNHLGGDDDSSADPIHYAEADRERMNARHAKPNGPL